MGVAQSRWYASAHPELATTSATLAHTTSNAPVAASVPKNSWNGLAGGESRCSITIPTLCHTAIQYLSAAPLGSRRGSHDGPSVGFSGVGENSALPNLTCDGWSRLCALAVQLSKADRPRERHRLRCEAQPVVARLVVENAFDRQR